MTPPGALAFTGVAILMAALALGLSTITRYDSARQTAAKKVWVLIVVLVGIAVIVASVWWEAL